MGLGGQNYAPADLSSGNKPSSPFTGGGVDPRAGLDG